MAAPAASENAPQRLGESVLATRLALSESARRAVLLDVAELRREHERRDQRDDRDQRDTGQPEDQHGRRDDRRRECPARDAANGEDAHARAAPTARERDVAGEAHRLGVVHRDTDARDRERSTRREVAVGDPDQADAERRERGADGHQPARADAVGDRTEQRLQERRPEAREQEERSCGRVRVAAVAHEERQERRYRSLHEVDRQVPERQRADPATIDPRGNRDDCRHARDASHGELDDGLLGPLGSPAVSGAQVAIGPADLVVEHGRELVEVAGRRERAIGRAVFEQAAERCGELGAGQRPLARLVPDGVAHVVAEHGQHGEVPLADAAQGGQRELEALAPAAAGGQRRPERIALLGDERLAQRVEQTLPGEAPAMKRHARDAGGRSDLLHRGRIPAARRDRGARRLDAARRWYALHSPRYTA